MGKVVGRVPRARMLKLAKESCVGATAGSGKHGPMTSFHCTLHEMHCTFNEHLLCYSPPSMCIIVCKEQ